MPVEYIWVSDGGVGLLKQVHHPLLHCKNPGCVHSGGRVSDGGVVIKKTKIGGTPYPRGKKVIERVHRAPRASDESLGVPLVKSKVVTRMVEEAHAGKNHSVF